MIAVEGLKMFRTHLLSHALKIYIQKWCYMSRVAAVLKVLMLVPKEKTKLTCQTELVRGRNEALPIGPQYSG